jgi:hypothetical protein
MQTYYIVASNDLLHFGKGHDDNPPGRGSGRYAWGSGDAKKKRGITGYFSRKKEKKAQDQAQAIAQQRVAAMNRAKEIEENKQKALMSASATEILRDYQGKLTNQELTYVVNRLTSEKTLKEYSAKERTSKVDQLNASMKKSATALQSANSLANAGTDLYNSFVGIYNSTPEGKKTPMTYIQKGNQQKKNDNQGGSN